LVIYHLPLFNVNDDIHCIDDSNNGRTTTMTIRQMIQNRIARLKIQMLKISFLFPSNRILDKPAMPRCFL